MNHVTTPCALPELSSDFLRSRHCLVDKLFAAVWKHVGMSGLLTRCGFQKRSGVGVNEVMYTLALWVWLKVDSISLFSRESLKSFCVGGKDIMYEAMNREDWDWRGLNLRVAQQAVRQLKQPGTASAFVLDDSIKTRSGKKMPGISSHFDHTTGRHVMGQQVVTLGLSCAEGFVPLDSELFISATKAQSLTIPFSDGRSIAAKRFRVAQEQTKPQMAKAMIARAQRAGIEAQYVLV